MPDKEENQTRAQNEARIRELGEAGDKLCTTRSGTDWEKENLADFILAKGRQGVLKHSELRDYLSNSQLELRRSREVYPTQGFPEKNIFSGIYRRTYNPLSRGERSSKAAPSLESDPTDE